MMANRKPSPGSKSFFLKSNLEQKVPRMAPAMTTGAKASTLVTSSMFVEL